MSQIIADVYGVLLDAENPPIELQHRVLQYASKNKNNALLARLANHRALDPSIDDMLRQNDSAVVKAAWAGRPGRTVEELTSLVTAEKRVTVLTALATRDDMPAKVYETIAAGASGQSALMALIANAVVDPEVKTRAARRLGQLVPADSEDLHRNKKVSGYTQFVTANPEYAGYILEETQSLGLMFAIATSVPLSPEQQRKVVSAVHDRYWAEISEATIRGSYGHGWMVHLAECLTDSGEADSVAADQLASLLELAQSRVELTTSNYKPDFLKPAVALRAAVGASRTNFLEGINTATTPDQIARIIEAVEKDGTRRGSSFDSARRASYALAIIASAASTPYQAVTVMDWLSWYTYSQALKVTSDPNKIAALIYTRPYVDVDAALGRLADPYACLALIVKMYAETDSQVAENVILSKYLTADIARGLPLKALLQSNVPSLVSGHIAGLITQGLTTDEAWSTFESISKGFSGSIEELLAVSSHV